MKGLPCYITALLRVRYSLTYYTPPGIPASLKELNFAVKSIATCDLNRGFTSKGPQSHSAVRIVGKEVHNLKRYRAN